MKNLYPWQEEAIAQIRGKNAVVSAPTGSGKTIVAYAWAGLLDGSFKEFDRVIFTAPIKALSNERFRELKEMFPGQVGIETGDIKNNVKKAKILCCTQEIYTLKYAKLPKQKVIIDEFHFVTQDANRARAYVDGIYNTSPKSSILVMSATFGDPKNVAQYLKNLANREFVLYNTDFRPTKQVFLQEEMTLEDIAQKNSIVFIFSYNGVNAIAEELADIKDFISSTQEKGLKKIAKQYKVKLKKFPEVYKGVGVYHGGLLPKEKFFMEEAFKKGFLQQIVGTDALALGVNLPAEAVFFGQLAKYYSGAITKNEFLQMAGRAGRKGYFDTGFIGYFNSGFENFEYSTPLLYQQLLQKEQEDFTIFIEPNWKGLLLRQKTVEQEVDFIARSSCPSVAREDVHLYIQDNLLFILNHLSKYDDSCDPTELGRVYFPEFSIQQNLSFFDLLKEHKNQNYSIKIENFLHPEIFEYANGKDLNYLLQVRKWYKSLPEEYKKIFEVNFEEKIIQAINNIDEYVFKYDDSISQIMILDSQEEEELEEENGLRP